MTPPFHQKPFKGIRGRDPKPRPPRSSLDDMHDTPSVALCNTSGPRHPSSPSGIRLDDRNSGYYSQRIKRVCKTGFPNSPGPYSMQNKSCIQHERLTCISGTERYWKTVHTSPSHHVLSYGNTLSSTIEQTNVELIRKWKIPYPC